MNYAKAYECEVIRVKITLKAARINAGLTQSDVAKKIGISRESLQNYESYRTCPSFVIASKLAELYDLPVDIIKFF